MQQEDNSQVTGIVAIVAILVIVGAVAFVLYRKNEPAPVAPGIEITLPAENPLNANQPQ